MYYHLHNIRQIRKFLTPASTKRLIVQGVIMARIYNCNGLLYGVPAVYLLNCNVFRIPQRDLSPIHPDTCTLPQCCLHCIGYQWSSDFAIKSLWSLSRLFTIWGLRNLVNIKRCSCSNLQSNVGVILQDPIAKFKCTLRDRDHLLQLLQRYGTVYWTTLGKRMILDMFKRLIKTHYFKEAYSALSWAIYGFYFLLLSSIFTSYLLWVMLN